MIFDYIVIGKGLIGSAASRYLSHSQKKIAVIGPDEHSDPEKAVVFSSHYDQARIQRIIGTDSTWTLLNLQSSAEYNFIEKESGIRFYSGVGCLYVNPHGSDDYLSQIERQANEFNLTYKFFENGDAICKMFRDLHLPKTSKGIFEFSPSGYINPRLLIKAQLDLFQKNNGTVINEIANEIGNEKNYVRVTTLDGNIYRAKQVLLCPGAFINFFNLTKNKLALSLKGETTLWANVTSKEAERLSKLPSLLYEIDIAAYKNIYLIQPVQYPDGKYYLKMGCNLPGDIYFDTIEEIQHWFRTGKSDENLEVQKDALLKIIPSLQAKEYFTKRCIVTFTKHRKPYVGALNDRGLFVACGGNGYGAMCSDALGRIAANLLTEGSFPEEYSPESFRPIFTENLH
ncbi:FAD-binding oxidoreductase [Ginsengibacter hankyongi]|uniref:FAD-binding oxidoreductase n=1 Tax=Ginsengibacter hankyongi TaxID=2607284 RepID=A0A5J5IDH4_9BACT|nr:FAD-binding oxidoreductase [Ginsengibacter hankyongi]KAA9037299.1 FAD-binding oxidoreductase [Ginsengibacter hankyongi]